MDDLIGKKFPVLDDGFVRLVDAMGDDACICEAARTSYGKGTRKTSEDRDLLRYLMRHWHTTPFEMAEIKLHVRVPMDTWRQWIRHRTASVNEYSMRYSEAIDSRQTTNPNEWRLQSGSNKQGSSGFLSSWSGEDGNPNRSNDSIEHSLDHWARVTAKVPAAVVLSPGEALSIIEADFHQEGHDIYRQRIHMGVAREQARKDLPLSTYTEAFWKCDLKNTLGFLRLRMDSHAQLEIRQYANVIGREIVAKLFPETWAAFEDYQLNAMTLSAKEQQAIRLIASGQAHADCLEELFPNKRERQECESKLIALAFIAKEP